MEQSKSGGLAALGGGAALNFAGFGVFTLCQFLALSLLGRLTGPDGVGLYGLALGIATPVFLFTNMSLRPAFATDLTGQWPFASYKLIRVGSAVAGILVSVVVAVFVRPDLGFVCLVAVMALAKAGEALSDLSYGVFQALEKVGLIGLSLGLRGAAGLALLAAGALVAAYGVETPMRGVLLGAATGILAGWWAVFLLNDRGRAAKHLRGDLAALRPGLLDHSRDTSRLLWAVLPLGLAIFLTSLQMMGPRFVVEDMFSLRALGFFTAVMALTSLGVQAVNMMGQVLVPRMAAGLRDGRRLQVLALLAVLMGFGAAGGLLYIGLGQMFGAPVLALLFGPEFAQGEHLFAVLALGGALRFVSEALRVGLVAARRFKTRLVVEVLAMAALIGAFGYWLHGFDAIEAAYAVLLAEIISILILIPVVAWVIFGATLETTRSGVLGD